MRCCYLLLLLFVLLLLPTACTQGEAGPIGSPGNPLVLAFVPSSDAPGSLEAQARKVADFVEQQTGLRVRPMVVADNAVVEGFGAGSVHVAFMGPKGYAEAFQRGGRIRLVSVRGSGDRHYYAMIFARADSGIDTLADVDGKSFAYRDVNSTSGYVFPRILFEANNIQLSETRAGGSHENVVELVHQGVVDTGAAYWSPPEISPEWAEQEGVSANDWIVDETGNVHFTSGHVFLWNGTMLDPDGNAMPDARIQPKDIRHRVVTNLPNVYREIRIVRLTKPIPNDGVVFHGNLPSDLAEKVLDALERFPQSEDGQATLQAMYNVVGLARTDDTQYEAFRAEIGRRR